MVSIFFITDLIQLRLKTESYHDCIELCEFHGFMISILHTYSSSGGCLDLIRQNILVEVELNNVTVNVTKHGMNVGNLVVMISPLSYSQFNNMGLRLPPELPVNMHGTT